MIAVLTMTIFGRLGKGLIPILNFQFIIYLQTSYLFVLKFFFEALRRTGLIITVSEKDCQGAKGFSVRHEVRKMLKAYVQTYCAFSAYKRP
jgi:hypothetical protein